MTQFSAMLLVLFIATDVPAQVEEKIRRVEHGLLRAYSLAGQPVTKFTVAERLEIYRTPGVSIALVDNGKLEWARGYGWACVAERRAVSPDTRFQAASISKPVAAMVALRLVELGKLSLDEDVNRKLRSWKVAKGEFTAREKVTLRRLLSHTAGLTVHGFPGYAAGSQVPTLRQLLDGVKPANTVAVRPDLTPGSRYRYSGGGYQVMQQLVEDVTGKPFAEVAQELVLAPLAMKHSTYRQPMPDSAARVAAWGYRSDKTAIEGKWHSYPELAAAGLWTTPSDLAKIILEIQKPGKVLRSRTVQEMLTPVRDEYGMGFSLGARNGTPYFSHGGSNEGFRCMLFAYREPARGAVVMTNSDSGQGVAVELLRSIAAEYGWPDFRQEQKRVAEVSESVLASYAGKYYMPNLTVTVSVDSGKLRVESRQGKVTLYPESENLFFDLDGFVPPFRFTKRADGAVEMKAQGFAAVRQ
jgi:CubicO group peptidase (beta-lactamase class C family)